MKDINGQRIMDTVSISVESVARCFGTMEIRSAHVDVRGKRKKMKKIIEDRYLGDGVYASFDGYQIWVDTRAQEPVSRIALEPGVMQSLERFQRDVSAAIHGIDDRPERQQFP